MPLAAWQVTGGVAWHSPLVETEQDQQVWEPLAEAKQSTRLALDAVAGAQVEDWAARPLAP